MSRFSIFWKQTVPKLACISLLSGLGLYFFMQPDGVADYSWYHLCQICLLIPAVYLVINLVLHFTQPTSGKLLSNLIQQDEVYFHGKIRDRIVLSDWLKWILLPSLTSVGLAYMWLQPAPVKYGMIALMAAIFLAGMLPMINQQFFRFPSHIWLTAQGVIFYGDEYVEIAWDELESVEWESENLIFHTRGGGSSEHMLYVSTREFKSYLEPIQLVLKKHAISYNW